MDAEAKVEDAPPEKKQKLESDNKDTETLTKEQKCDLAAGETILSKAGEVTAVEDSSKKETTDSKTKAEVKQEDAPPKKKQKLEINDNETEREEKCDLAAEEITLSETGEVTAADASSKDETMTNVLSETDMGITEYISSHKGFNAVIKQRYSDFVVNEISEQGEVIHLTSRELPKDDGKVFVDLEVDVLSDSDQDKLQKLLENPDKNAVVFLEAEVDKEMRTKMHKAIKTMFPSLNSNTVEEKGKKCLKISKIKTDQRMRPEWKPGRGHFCRFVLYKENKDTMDAISLISKLARLKTQLFRYAGTKDKRAKTSQEITAHRVTANKLDAVNARLRNMMMGNFRYVSEHLTLGQLQGNHFTVVLRNVTGSDEQIEAAMTSLKSAGFINYYGMQRFGTTSIPTHHVGKALLHGNWEEAVDLILKPRVGEDQSMSKCREAWSKSRDPSEALPHVPNHHNIEKTLLQTLVRQGERNYSAALQAIPRQTRQMYVHAYQSFIWNTVTSRRLNTLGYTVSVGDLVIPRNDKVEDKGDDAKKAEPVVVTEENKSEYSLQDVVLPLPGYDVVYPTGQVGTWYKELMEEDDLDMDKMKQKNKDYSLPGDYRYLVVTPGDVKWGVFNYDDYTIPLARGDLDVMFNKPEPKDVKDGKFRALRIEMSLPASVYATMALREVLKINTSSAFQSTLNVT